MENTPAPAQTFDLFELIRLVLKHRGKVITIVLLAAVAAVAYSLLTPEIWSSDAAFYAVSESNQQLPVGLLAAGNFGDALLEEISEAEAQNCVTIMTSRSMTEAVIRKFDLITYFKLDKPDSLANLDEAIRKLEKNVMADYGDHTSLITLSVETKSKKLSRQIAEFYISSLDSYLRTQKITTGRRNRIFLEARLQETRHQLDSLQTAVQNFQTRNQAIDLPGQTEQLVNTYADLVAQKMNLEIQLELAKANYAPDTPLIKDLELQLTELSRQIRELEQKPAHTQNKYQLDISRLPALQQQLTRLNLDIAVASKVLDYLQPQYEAAKLDELRNLPALEMVDTPRESGHRVRPKRALICIITVFMAFFASVLLVVVLEIINTHPHRIQAIKDTLHARSGDQA